MGDCIQRILLGKAINCHDNHSSRPDAALGFDHNQSNDVWWFLPFGPDPALKGLGFWFFAPNETK